MRSSRFEKEAVGGCLKRIEGINRELEGILTL